MKKFRKNKILFKKNKKGQYIKFFHIKKTKKTNLKKNNIKNNNK